MAMNLAKEVSSITPAKAVFGSVSILLITIITLFSGEPPSFTCNQDSMANKTDYEELGLVCADVCAALGRGMDGKRLDDVKQSVREAIAQLSMWVNR